MNVDCDSEHKEKKKKRNHGVPPQFQRATRGPFLKSPGNFSARESIFSSSVFKNGEVNTPETIFMKENSVHIENMWIKQLCNRKIRDLLWLYGPEKFRGLSAINGLQGQQLNDEYFISPEFGKVKTPPRWYNDTSEVAMALDFDTVQRIEMFQGVLMFDYVQWCIQPVTCKSQCL